MNRTKRKGPSIEPCGTPLLTVVQLEIFPSSTTLCRRSERYSLINWSILPLMLYSTLSLLRITSWETLSKAFLKSKNTISPNSLSHPIGCVLLLLSHLI
eukprot:sb/3478636/